MTRQQLREAALRDAMQDLLGDPRFQTYLEAIRELRDGAVSYVVAHTTVRDEREYLAAVGEIRVLNDILGIAEAHQQAVEHGLEKQQNQEVA